MPRTSIVSRPQATFTPIAASVSRNAPRCSHGAPCNVTCPPATAVAGGHVTLQGAPCEHLGAFLETLAAMGVNVACGRDTIDVRGIPPGEGAYRACDVETGPYPGLATDLQSPVSVLLTRGAGTSHLSYTHLRAHETRHDLVCRLL